MDVNWSIYPVYTGNMTIIRMSSGSSLDASPGDSDAEIQERGSGDADESEAESEMGWKPYSFDPQCELNSRLK